MDLTEYRNSDLEQKRIRDLINLLPQHGGSVLDIGARDGYISNLLTEFFDLVTALDLTTPDIRNEKVRCVKGDLTALDFPDGCFDFVLCAEVLEHIPPKVLGKACLELQRVTRGHLVVGVPFRQDIRVGRTTCSACGGKNPPWGHVNIFDKSRLKRLFPEMAIEKISLVGKNDSATNFLSTYLMDLAGNPYGTYSQEELCVFCSSKLKAPAQRSYLQKAETRLALLINMMQKPFIKAHPNWIHVLFTKETKAC